MRNRFSEYYTGNDEHFDEFFNNAIIVLDTNILLNLYRFNNENRDKFFEILKKLENRLYMTYHIGHEFFKNREEIIYSYKNYQKNVQEEIEKEITRIISSIEKNQVKGSEFLKHEKGLISSIIKVLNKSKADIITILNEPKINDPEPEILNRIENLYKDKVGKELNKKELEAIYKDGKIRFENEIPPGYKDISKSKGKENNITQYGDLVIWKEMIKYAKEKGKNILFISDDKKEDWIRKIKGERKGPRIELMKEFKKETKANFYSLNSDSFIKKMSKKYSIDKTEDLEEEIQKLKKESEINIFDQYYSDMEFRENNDYHIKEIQKYVKNLINVLNSLQVSFPLLRDNIFIDELLLVIKEVDFKSLYPVKIQSKINLLEYIWEGLMSSGFPNNDIPNHILYLIDKLKELERTILRNIRKIEGKICY